jgi:hypothetical protein
MSHVADNRHPASRFISLLRYLLMNSHVEISFVRVAFDLCSIYEFSKVAAC